MGRFTQADTLIPEPGNPLALDRYAYVNNNPLKYIDPNGHDPCTPDGECGPYDYDPWQHYSLPDHLYNQNEPPPPKSPIYNPQESVDQAVGLVIEWFFELGPDKPRYFGPEDSITQDVMHDVGMEEFRKEWADHGYELPFSYRHEADKRHGWLPLRIAVSVYVFTREHLVQLPLSVIGFYSQSPEGHLDAVGGTIGSLDTITATDVGNNMVKISVYNRMDWRSAVRIPGFEGFLPSYSREQVRFGGALDMYFVWQEQIP